MSARVLQVNVAPQGGVPKRPVPQAMVRRLGLEGDGQADRRVHGGPLLDVAAVQRLVALGFPVFAGALGENLTTQRLDPQALPPGARLRAGEAMLQVTKAREPCRTIHVWGGAAIGKAVFDARVAAGEAASPLWGASGLYCRVLREGRVCEGDPVGPG